MQQDIATSIGFVNFYGNSPELNLLEDSTLKTSETVRILLDGTCDLRHMFKTLIENLDNYGDIKNLEFYILEKDPIIIARGILMTEIINNSKISYRERMELFFDIYWNCFMREKTQEYLDQRTRHLEDVICDYEKCPLGIKELWDFSCYKFKDQDAVVDSFKRMNSKFPFDLDKYRDDRQRHLFKDRYDWRKNLYDWDYIWGVKEVAPIIHPREYKDWRHGGVAFEVRTASYIVPNRTMSAYVDGNRKTTKDSCIVLGFWGDVVLSPFFTLGVKTDSCPEREKLFRVRNKHHIHISQHVAEFNCYNTIYTLEKLENYHLDWDEEDKIKAQETDEEIAKLQAKKEGKLESIKEQPEEEDDNLNDTAEQKEIKKIERDRKVAGDRQNLITLNVEDPIKKEEEDTFNRELLQGFKRVNIKIIPLSEPVEKLATKKKFNDKFDVASIGFLSALDTRTDGLEKIMKNGGIVFQENSHYLVPLELKKRPDANSNIINNAAKYLHNVEFEEKSQFKFIVKKVEQANN